MYQVSPPTAVVRAHRRLLPRMAPVARIKTVLLLGLTSLFTDISSEMVTTILPLYLVYIGNFSPLAFGVIDGIYNGATAIVRLASGYIGDRWQRHKEVAAIGLWPVGHLQARRSSLPAGGSSIGAIVLIDRIGKGIRTAPARRDDLAVDPEGAARRGLRGAPCHGHGAAR